MTTTRDGVLRGIGNTPLVELRKVVPPHSSRRDVRAVILGDWLSESGAPPPDVVKIDVEGSDDAVLRGGARTFAKYRPAIYLDLHGERQRRTGRDLLASWGYEVTSLEPGLVPDLSSEWLAEPLG